MPYCNPHPYLPPPIPKVRKLRQLLEMQQSHQQLQLDYDGSGTILRRGGKDLPGGQGEQGGQGGYSDSAPSAVMLQEMEGRVKELEMQLAERERLIESLELMRTGAGAAGDSDDSAAAASSSSSYTRDHRRAGVDFYEDARQSLTDQVTYDEGFNGKL